MKRFIHWISILALLVVAPALFASGAPKVTPQSQLTPQQKAARSFNEGIRHRDKARKYEEALKSETEAEKIAKLEAKIVKEYEKAIDDYKDAIENDPNMFQAYGSMGYALRKSGDYSSSLEAYDKALTLAPGYAEAIEYRGEAYLALGRVNDAKIAYLTLSNGGSDRAGELLVAMRTFVDQKQQSGVDVAEFSEWVAKREAVQTMSGATASTSGGSW